MTYMTTNLCLRKVAFIRYARNCFFSCVLILRTQCLIQGDKRTCCGCTLTLQYLKQQDSGHKAFNLGHSFVCDFR